MPPRVNWPQESTAQAFAWLDHCIATHKNFRDTILHRLNTTTDKKHFSTWSQVYLHMVNYAQKQVDDQTSLAIRRKLMANYCTNKECMDNLLHDGTSIVPNLTGDTPMANLIAGIKSSLAKPNDVGNAGVKMENDDKDEDQDINRDVYMIDDDSDDDQSTTLESSESEYMGGRPQRSSGAAGPNTLPKLRNKRQQSSTTELPSPKRARLATQARQSRDLGEDELSVEEPSREGFVGRSLRPILPAKAPQPRKATAERMEHHVERPEDAPLIPAKPHHEARAQDTAEKGLPHVPSLILPRSPKRQVQIKGLDQQERAPLYDPEMTISETPNAQFDSESQQGSSEASTEMAAGIETARSKSHATSVRAESVLARENARLWEMYNHEKNEKLEYKRTNSTLRMILTSPNNNEQLFAARYLQLCDRFKSQDQMKDDLREVELGLPQVRDGELASQFHDLQTIIRSACHSITLLNLEQTLAVSSNDTIRDKKIELLCRTAFGQGLNAWDLSQEEDGDLFRGFVTAHIFHFVFESNFPSRYSGHEDCAILREYRNICFERDGAMGLYVNERVALQSYLKDKHMWRMDEKRPFQDSVRMKAAELARDVAELLAPLSVPVNIVANGLESAYVAALKMKANMVMSNKTYMARFVRPGEPIDADCMMVDNHYENPNARNIKQCMFPVIYTTPLPDIDPLYTEKSQCLINYTNFSVLESQYDRPSMAKGETILFKGMVVV